MSNLMKFLSVASAFSIMSQACYAQITTSIQPGNVLNIGYGFDSTKPATGMQSFKTQWRFLTLDPSPSGTRFLATQFWLDPVDHSGGGDTLYIGINPPNQAINYAGQVHFSYFGAKGGTLYNQNCHAGADGGGGITCALDSVKALPGQTYRFEAKITKATATATTLEGNVQVFDTYGNMIDSQQIGSFDVLRTNMELTYPGSWVEGTSDPCSSLTRTMVEYSPFWRNGNIDAADAVNLNSISGKCPFTYSVYTFSDGTQSVRIQYGN